MGILLPGIFPRADSTPAPFTRSDLAAERVARAAELQQKFLSSEYQGEIYGPIAFDDQAKHTDIMPDPDSLYSEFGFADDSICDRMARNVPDYGALVEGDIDVAMSLEGAFVAGVKGDPESEQARAEVEDAWAAMTMRDRHVTERFLCYSRERGFMGAENVFGVVNFGSARDLITIVEMIDRPRKIFAFDYDRTPYIKRDGRSERPQRVDDYKVTFQRCGSLNTPHGSGYAQKAYPTVWAVHQTMLGHMALVERFGYMPVEMHYPTNWPPWKVQTHYRNALANWKNILPVPDDTAEGISFKPFPTDAAYANANASGSQRMAYVDRQISGLARLIRGSMLSSPNQAEGSFARDQTADEAQLWKAPTSAAARESMVCRGFIEPTILVNRPTLERHKWPRYVVDASFGEDLRLFMELCEFAANHGILVDQVVWSERTGIPLAQEGASVIESSAPNLTPALPDVVDESVRRLSEPWITIVTPRGVRRVSPDDPIMTESGTVIRAAKLQTGTRILDPEQIRKRFRALS